MTKPDDNYRKLADEFFELKQELAAVEDAVTRARAAILETGRAVIRGDEARVTVTSGSRRSLDVEAVREFLTPAQMARCWRVTETNVVRVEPIRVKPVPAPSAARGEPSAASDLFW